MMTRTFSDALEQLRHEEADRFLWIDALCINQGDDRERNVPVRNMFEIFAKARQVVAWLGKAGPHTYVALGYLADRDLSKESKGRREYQERPVVFSSGILDVSAAMGTPSLGATRSVCRPGDRS